MILGRFSIPHSLSFLQGFSNTKNNGYLGVIMNLSGVFNPKTQLIDALIEFYYLPLLSWFSRGSRDELHNRLRILSRVKSVSYSHTQFPFPAFKPNIVYRKDVEILKVSPTRAPYPSEFQAYQRDKILGNIATDVFIVSNSISKPLPRSAAQ